MLTKKYIKFLEVARSQDNAESSSRSQNRGATPSVLWGMQCHKKSGFQEKETGKENHLAINYVLSAGSI